MKGFARYLSRGNDTHRLTPLSRVDSSLGSEVYWRQPVLHPNAKRPPVFGSRLFLFVERKILSKLLRFPHSSVENWVPTGFIAYRLCKMQKGCNGVLFIGLEPPNR